MWLSDTQSNFTLNALILLKELNWDFGEITEIGVGLTAFGVFFMVLGILLFFDGGLLAIGNVLLPFIIIIHFFFGNLGNIVLTLGDFIFGRTHSHYWIQKDAGLFWTTRKSTRNPLFLWWSAPCVPEVADGGNGTRNVWIHEFIWVNFSLSQWMDSLTD
jgi:hypothetical protein